MSQRTKEALAASLKSMLCERPLNKITISDLTDSCGINRMTFYYHFKDIYDLIGWICMEDAYKALEGNKSLENWVQGLENLVDVMYADKAFIINAYYSIEQEKIEEYIYRVIDGLAKFAISEVEGLDHVSETDQQFICDFYNYAMMGLLFQWIREDMPDKRKEMVERITTIMDGKLQQSVRLFALKNIRQEKELLKEQ